jgi:RNA polymerase sigma-70 factor (ECF subfamily)
MAGRSRPRSTQALEEIYDEHVWRVYGFFAYRLRSREDAEDLTQATFERAAKALDRFDPRRASPGTWLIAIAGNLLVDHYRRHANRHEEPLDGRDGAASEPVADAPDPSDIGIDPALAAALEALSERDRDVVALRYGADLTGPEIAELKGLTLANVQQILSRSLRRMRALIDERDSAATSASKPVKSR